MDMQAANPEDQCQCGSSHCLELNIPRDLDTILNPRIIYQNSIQLSRIAPYFTNRQMDISSYLALLSEYKISKHCGYVWQSGQVAYRCKTCSSSAFMSICADCFRAGNHEGHDYYMFKSRSGGACDCGFSIMKESGHCNKHGPNAKAKRHHEQIPKNLICVPARSMPRLVHRLAVSLRRSHVDLDGEPDVFTECLSDIASSNVILRDLMIDALISEEVYSSQINMLSNHPDMEISRITNEGLKKLKRERKGLLSFRVPEAWKSPSNIRAFCDNLTPTCFLEELVFWSVVFEFPQKLVCFLLSFLMDTRYKYAFARSFVAYYPRILMILASFRGEPKRHHYDSFEQLSSRIRHITVQFYNNEELTKMLVDEESALHTIVYCLRIAIEGDINTGLKGVLKPNPMGTGQPQVVNFDSLIIRNNHLQCFVHDFTSILDEQPLKLLNDHDLLLCWLEMVSYFQTINPYKRALDEHTPYDTGHQISLFTIESDYCLTPLWSLLAPLKTRSVTSIKHSDTLFRLLQTNLCNWFHKMGIGPSSLLDPYYISFHIPLHRMFAATLRHMLYTQNRSAQEVLELIKHNQSILGTKYGYKSASGISKDVTTNCFFRMLLLHPLQTLTICSETKCNMWIRNGLMAVHQAVTYVHCAYCYSSIDLDMFLMKYCSSQLNPNHFLNTLMSRFHAWKWLSFKSGILMNNDSRKTYNFNILPEQILQMVENALLLILQILTLPLHCSVSEKEQTRQEMIALISVRDRSYSYLTDMLPDKNLTEASCDDETFRALLEELTIYKPAQHGMTGNLQQGCYALKPNVWFEEYDPIMIQYRLNQKKDYQVSLERFFQHCKLTGKLEKRYSQQSALWPPFSIPKEIGNFGKFDLSPLVECPTLAGIVYSILFKSLYIGEVPDVIIAYAVHLLELSLRKELQYVTEEKNSFDPHCTSGSKKQTNSAFTGKYSYRHLISSPISQSGANIGDEASYLRGYALYSVTKGERQEQHVPSTSTTFTCTPNDAECVGDQDYCESRIFPVVRHALDLAYDSTWFPFNSMAGNCLVHVELVHSMPSKEFDLLINCSPNQGCDQMSLDDNVDTKTTAAASTPAAAAIDATTHLPGPRQRRVVSMSCCEEQLENKFEDEEAYTVATNYNDGNQDITLQEDELERSEIGNEDNEGEEELEEDGDEEDEEEDDEEEEEEDDEEEDDEEDEEVNSVNEGSLQVYPENLVIERRQRAIDAPETRPLIEGVAPPLALEGATGNNSSSSPALASSLSTAVAMVSDEQTFTSDYPQSQEILIRQERQVINGESSVPAISYVSSNSSSNRVASSTSSSSSLSELDIQNRFVGFFQSKSDVPYASSSSSSSSLSVPPTRGQTGSAIGGGGGAAAAAATATTVRTTTQIGTGRAGRPRAYRQRQMARRGGLESRSGSGSGGTGDGNLFALHNPTNLQTAQSQFRAPLGPALTGSRSSASSSGAANLQRVQSGSAEPAPSDAHHASSWETLRTQFGVAGGKMRPVGSNLRLQEHLRKYRSSRRSVRKDKMQHGESILSLLLRLHAKYSHQVRSYHYNDERARELSANRDARRKARVGDGVHFVTIVLDLICTLDQTMRMRVARLQELIWNATSKQEGGGGGAQEVLDKEEFRSSSSSLLSSSGIGKRGGRSYMPMSEEYPMEVEDESSLMSDAPASFFKGAKCDDMMKTTTRFNIKTNSLESTTSKSTDSSSSSHKIAAGYKCSPGGSSWSFQNSKLESASSQQQQQQQPSTSSASMDPSERKRRAKEFQSKLMAHFANKQRAFIEKYESQRAFTGGGHVQAAHSASSSLDKTTPSTATAAVASSSNRSDATANVDDDDYHEGEPINLSSNSRSAAVNTTKEEKLPRPGEPQMDDRDKSQQKGPSTTTHLPSMDCRRSDKTAATDELHQSDKPAPSSSHSIGGKASPEPQQATQESAAAAADSCCYYECCICGVSEQVAGATTRGMPAPEQLSNPLGQVVLLQSTSVLGHSHLRPKCERKLPCEEAEYLRLRGETLARHLDGWIKLLCEHFSDSSRLDSLNIGVEGGVHVQSCGHYLHIECHQSYIKSLDQERARFRNDSDEFLCPVCRQLANSVLPILSSSGSSGISSATPLMAPPPQEEAGGGGGGCFNFNDQIELISSLLTSERRLAPNQLELQSSASFCAHLTKATGTQYRLVRSTPSMHSLFLFLTSIARTNLETEIIEYSLSECLRKQRDSEGFSLSSPPSSVIKRKSSFMHLFRVLALNAQALINDHWFTCHQTWFKLTRQPPLPFASSPQQQQQLVPSSSREVPLLFRDPIAMLLQFLFVLSNSFDHENRANFTCIIQVLFNLTVIQSLALVLSHVKPPSHLLHSKSHSSSFVQLIAQVWNHLEPLLNRQVLLQQANDHSSGSSLDAAHNSWLARLASMKSDLLRVIEGGKEGGVSSVNEKKLLPKEREEEDEKTFTSKSDKDEDGDKGRSRGKEEEEQLILIESCLKLACLPFLRACTLIQHHLYNQAYPELEQVDDESMSDFQAIKADFLTLTSFLNLTQPFPFSASQEGGVASTHHLFGADLMKSLKWPLETNCSPDYDNNNPIIASWCQQVLTFSVHAGHQSEESALALLSSRAACWFRASLMQLPNSFDDIFMHYYRKKCALCQQVPRDVVICLVCGAPICFRVSCCKDKSRNRLVHSQHCGANTAVFLAVHTSSIVVIRGSRACVWGSVYLDAHGEEDNGLLRGKPLFLVPARYALLEHQWLTHSFDHKYSKPWIYLQEQRGQ